MARSPSAADLGIGIVGCGRAAGSLHLPALGRVRGAAVVALCDRDPVALRRLSAGCADANAYADFRALLDDPRVALVAVCVPAAEHAEIAVAALQAQKHVLVEKPLALTLEDCDRLVERGRRADSAGIRSAVGFNLRSHRLLRQAKAIVQSGRLGEIELLRLLWTADWSGMPRAPWHVVRGEGGGALLEIGAHQADLARWLLESEVEQIHAFSRSPVFDDQTAVLEARMANGVLVSASVSQRSVSHNVVELLGDRGSLRLSCYHADSLEVSVTGGRSNGAWRRLRPLAVKAAGLPAVIGAARRGGDFRMSYALQWARIVAAVRDGGPVPASLHDGRQAVRIIRAALRSAEEGVVVPLTTAAAVPARAHAREA